MRPRWYCWWCGRRRKAGKGEGGRGGPSGLDLTTDSIVDMVLVVIEGWDCNVAIKL